MTRRLNLSRHKSINLFSPRSKGLRGAAIIMCPLYALCSYAIIIKHTRSLTTYPMSSTNDSGSDRIICASHEKKQPLLTTTTKPATEHTKSPRKTAFSLNFRMQFVLSGGGPVIFYNIPMPIWPSFQNKKLEKSGETQETGNKKTGLIYCNSLGVCSQHNKSQWGRAGHISCTHVCVL